VSHNITDANSALAAWKNSIKCEHNVFNYHNNKHSQYLTLYKLSFYWGCFFIKSSKFIKAAVCKYNDILTDELDLYFYLIISIEEQRLPSVNQTVCVINIYCYWMDITNVYILKC